MPVATPSLATMAAQQAITDNLHRYCRAMDRMDRELALSCWHPGGTDEQAVRHHNYGGAQRKRRCDYGDLQQLHPPGDSAPRSIT